MLSQKYEDWFTPELVSLYAAYLKSEDDLANIDETKSNFENLEALAEEAYEAFKDLYEKTFNECLAV